MAQTGQALVIGIAGRIGAGKTTAGQYLATVHHFQYVRYSQVLSDWLAEDPDSKNRLQTLGWEVMAGGMQPELNTRLIARIESGRDCAVDGLRHPIDYDSLKNAFASAFFLLYIDCPPEVRWERLKHKPRYKTFEGFRAADSHPVEQETENLRPKAYAVLPNTGSLDQFQSAIDSILHRIRSGEPK